MTDFKPGDKVRMFGDPEFTGTVTATRKCNDKSAIEACDETMVTFEDDGIGTTHHAHASDLEPA